MHGQTNLKKENITSWFNEWRYLKRIVVTERMVMNNN
jgi:hypothetical protein